MRTVLTLLTFILILLLDSVHAAPASGRYVGVLTITKKIDGLSVTTSVRAEAKVSADGRLSIVVASPEGPLPQTQISDTLYVQASNVLQTNITADNTCIVPGRRIPPTLPPGTILTVSNPSPYITFQVPSPFTGYYTHLGRIRIADNRFYLSYTDLARELTWLVPPSSTTEFNYTFRRSGN